MNIFLIEYDKYIDSPFFPLTIFVVMVAMFWCLNRFLKSYLSNPRHHVRSVTEAVWNAVHDAPIYLIGVGIALWLMRVKTTPPTEVAEVFHGVQFLVLLTAAIIIVLRVIIRFIESKAQQAGSKGTTLLVTLVEGTGIVFGVIIFLGAYGISIAPFVTALGIGGMAVALGLQETLANIFSGLQLILSRQIIVGDHIKLSSGEEGEVTDITWRYTTIQIATKNYVIVPNKTIAAATITNYDRPQKNLAVVVAVGVSYDSDLDKVERVTLDVAREVLKEIEEEAAREGRTLPTPAEPTMKYHTLADSSINFNVVISVADYASQFKVKHEFIKALIKRYREEGIDIPFPTRTIVNG